MCFILRVLVRFDVTVKHVIGSHDEVVSVSVFELIDHTLKLLFGKLSRCHCRLQLLQHLFSLCLNLLLRTFGLLDIIVLVVDVSGG